MAILRPHAASPARRRAPAGFTLIEVLVALAIVAIAFVGLLGLHNGNLRVVSHDQNLATATLLAREYITQFELVEQWPELGSTGGTIEKAPGFAWEREVTEVPDLPSLRRIDLRIIWDPRIPDACRLTYYIRDRRDPQP